MVPISQYSERRVWVGPLSSRVHRRMSFPTLPRAEQSEALFGLQLYYPYFVMVIQSESGVFAAFLRRTIFCFLLRFRVFINVRDTV